MFSVSQFILMVRGSGFIQNEGTVRPSCARQA